MQGGYHQANNATQLDPSSPEEETNLWALNTANQEMDQYSITMNANRSNVNQVMETTMALSTKNSSFEDKMAQLP